MKFDCDCPDWAGMCKHVAAVLYGVGARLDHSPEMLFLLRGVNHEELVDVSAAVRGAATAGTSRRRIAASGLADVFGVDMAEAGMADFETPAICPTKKTKAAVKQQPFVTTGKITVSPPKTLNKKLSPVTSRKSKQPAEIVYFPDPLTGGVIHAWRTSLGATQSVFAERLGITAASISQWEKKGKHAIGIQARTLSALLRAWEMTH
jgi:DNA-binding transcriptional regulator YiaG